jgi:hypothetical protein
MQHDDITDAAVLGRAADLVVYLGLDFPSADPQRRSIGGLVRAISRAGELIVSVVVIVCSGMGLVGLATLL